ncbi:hypothetical protein JCM10213_004519 [Rhodosporidiobolus nylandii]
MRPFVVRLDPTSFDRDAASSAPGKEDLESLKQTWNAWNGRVRGLLDQDSRIENLFWRRWHMEQQQGSVQHASPALHQGTFPHDLSASVEAVERRRATEDLEAFLRNTLQAAQPGGAEVVHNPPTYDAFRPTSTAGPQPPIVPPAPQNNFQPPVVHAPQPQRVAFNPSPEWGYASLPSVSAPPPTSSAAAHQSRIIATPSWTALIQDPVAQAAVAAMANGQVPHPPQPQPQAPQQPQAPLAQPQPQLPSLQFPGGALGFSHLFPPTAPHPVDPFAAAAAAAGFAFGAPPTIPNPAPPPVPSPSFALPPNATLFSDLTSALSSAPPAAAPPAFFSSYGMYQPVVAPYPRFLTPSPEPSVLGELELELGPATGEFDANAVAAPAVPAAEPDGLDAVWKDLETRTAGGESATNEKKDPFEGMSLAQMRSRANSLEAIDREAAQRFEAYGVSAGGASMAEQAAREVQQAAAQAEAQAGAPSASPVAAKGKSAAAKGKRKAENGAGGAGKKTKGGASPPDSGEGAGAAATGASKLLPGGKKNRNPHSTQLPGNGQRRQQKEEAGEGHEGPICSHCGSITTPLWRRGPEDELLCNACGLYLKLHGRSRPKTFGKNNGSKRSSNGAAAQAAASGVPPSCNNCGATSTPMWRKDQEGRLCCNACSLYYKLHKVPRPASLAQKRKAAAAAKANLAAAAAAAAAGLPPPPPVDANAEASTSAQGQPPTPAASTSTAPASTAEVPVTPAVMPPPPPPQSLPPQPGQPVDPANPPAVPAQFMHQPPLWQLPPGYPPPGAMLPPNGLHHPPPGLHHPQPQLPGQQQKFTLPPAIPAPLPPSPFAQTAWGALAYGIVSAAAAEEAGGGPAPMPPGAQPPPPGP